MRSLSAALLVLAVVGPWSCSTHLQVPATLSPPPLPMPGAALRAGLARADITPPIGVGLAGNGPEGAASRGYRLRLYARVLVLADSVGNRLAIVVADLPLGSALLHRRVAALTSESDGIGVDRLVIAATHTHAGPGHYLDAAVYNDLGSSVEGYDPVFLDSLSARIARAVHTAAANLQPARVAWGSRAVWGYTRIRSVPAIVRNIPPPTARADAPTSLPLEYRLVDPELSMLRVDRFDPMDGHYRPAGAFSIFAMHNTGNAPANDLLDADIAGIVERRLERHIDSDLNQRGAPAFVPHAVYLFANGTEGDVSPAWPLQSRCDVPTLAVRDALDGPFSYPLLHWRPPTVSHVASCEHYARVAAEQIGNGLGDNAIVLFDSLGSALRDHLDLGRSFVTLSLRDDARKLGICPEAAVGMSALAGADDSHSRVEGWRLLGVFSIGLEQGAPNPAVHGCQAQKRTLLDTWFGDLPNRLFVTSTLPSYAQVSVFLLGDRLVGTLPGEVTTIAGRRMQAQMMAAARERGLKISEALIMSLTNGYLEYITTPEEYTAQYYEGGSTLYGPGEALMFGRTLAGLVAKVSSGDTLPKSAAPDIKDNVGHKRAVLPRQQVEQKAPPVVEEAHCSGDTLYARLSFGSAEDWPVSSGETATDPRVEIIAAPARDSVVSWDDDPALELRLVGQHRGVASWELRWSKATPGPYRIRIQDRAERSVNCVESLP